MILIFVFIIMTLLGFILMKNGMGKVFTDDEDTDIYGGIIGGFGFVCLIISLIIIIAAHATANM